MATIPNRNIFWAKTFVDELARCGLETVCIAPGSRSTPLVIAFAENPRIRVYSHIDERSAAFFALGLALATDKPVAILCSSGTATANFHPAIIEARYANAPLLVLTADRPHELRDSGANQTVDQVKMFGSHVLWAYDAALPEAQPPAVAVRNLRTLADRAYAKANGLSGLEKGPVHLNFPFRKPLEPTPVEQDQTDVEPYHEAAPFATFSRGELRPTDAQINLLMAMLKESPRGLIICGPRTPRSLAGREIEWFRQATGFPLFADILSDVRALPALAIAEVISAYDTFLADDPPFDPPDMLIHFGAMPASASLEAYLNKIQPRYRVLITETGVWTDAYHRLTHVIRAEPGLVCAKVVERRVPPTVDQAWAERVFEVSRETWKVVQPALEAALFDGSAIATAINTFAQLSTAQATGFNLFLASSLPVRHAEQYVSSSGWIPRVFSNRGASGIDGTISSALGVAAARPSEHTVLIIGDLAFYHDMNGLLAIKRCGITNLTIILINNEGGGIFQRLPIAQFDPPFTELFLTPHGLDFEPAVRMYGLDYHRAASLPELRERIGETVETRRPTVIEIRTDSTTDLQRRNEINQAVQNRLTELYRKQKDTQQS